MSGSEPSFPPTFELIMQELTGILEQLESGDLSLEQSIQLYERGVLLGRHGQGLLQDAQLKIDKLTRMGIVGVESSTPPEEQ